MLHQDIKNEIKDAMKAREEVRLGVLRGIVAACTNELVAQKKKPQEMLDDASVLAVIKRLVKQRKDSIEKFRKGNREDLAEVEQSELVYLEKYLPAMMSVEEIRALAIVKKQIMLISDPAKKG